MIFGSPCGSFVVRFHPIKSIILSIVFLLFNLFSLFLLLLFLYYTKRIESRGWFEFDSLVSIIIVSFL